MNYDEIFKIFDIVLSFMLTSFIMEETYKFNARNDSNEELNFFIAYANSINVYPVLYC